MKRPVKKSALRTRFTASTGVDVAPQIRPPRPPRPIRDPGPLLLLPLRLEYRFVEARLRPEVADISSELATLAKLDALHKGTTLKARRALMAERRKISTKLLRSDVTRASAIGRGGGVELWVRWFPDDGFAAKGIAPETEAEKAARLSFSAQLAGRPWYDPGDADGMAAWSTFATTVGAHRAVQLMRGIANPAGYEEDIGRIAALPKRVSLFAITGGVPVLLASGGDIPANTASARSIVSYTPEAIEPGGWLRDFPIALKHGMGVKIADAGAIAAALAADNIVAIGMYGSDAKSELSGFLLDAVANGNFEILEPDTATNNGPGSPSGHADPGRDLVGFLADATQQERGGFTTPSKTAADQLARALGLPLNAMTPAVKAAATPFADAQAMLRVIGPALLDGALDGTTQVKDVDENEFVEALALATCARGPLPALRFGRNPFGVLPLIQIADVELAETKAETVAIQEFLKAVASWARSFLPNYAESVVPRIEPGDAQAAAKLDLILKNNPTSRRLDVSDEGQSKTAPIGCPYVSGAKAENQPQTYLQNLLTKPLEALPDPDESDLATPLLYRLARMTLTRNIVYPIFESSRPAGTKPVKGIVTFFDLNNDVRGKVFATDATKISLNSLVKATAIKGVDVTALKLMRKLNANFVEALQHLLSVAARPNGVAQLEAMLIEVFDLMQHRIDAVATGFAYRRLQLQREAGNEALGLGYFGFLGKLRPTSTTGATDGYLQAPSMAQATTAALLRSAFLRHRADGAFAIDHGSRRVRRALVLLDVLKKGLRLEEALGLSGERWLHDRKLSRLTLPLRLAFPFENPTPPEGGTPRPSGMRTFDGLKAIRGSVQGFAAADRPKLAELQAALADELDALSDIIMAEAVHQRAQGQAAAAKAWLDVLSGASVPGEPQFVRTQRTGQGSSHRASLLFPPATATTSSSAREVAEPGFSAFAEKVVPDFSTMRLVLTIARNDNPARRHVMTIKLEADLGMKPIDLVVGGLSEVKARAGFFALERWLVTPAMTQDLGSVVAQGLMAFVNQTVTLTVADAPQGPSLAAGLAAAEKLRRLSGQGRMLDPADLNAAASPADKLAEIKEISLIAGATTDLLDRASMLAQRIDDARATLVAEHAPFVAELREIRRRADIDAEDPTLTSLRSAAELKRRSVHALLPLIASFAEPGALSPFTIEEAAANPDFVDETLLSLSAHLADKAQRLRDAVAQSAAPATRLEEARRARRLLIEALRAALDGEALPIFAAIARRPETTPLLENSQAVSNALSPWSNVRPRLALMAEFSVTITNLKAQATKADATADDTAVGERDPRPAEIAPRALHFGTFIAAPGVTTATSVCGLVVDEWAEQRPSRMQPAAIAINYDSPQAEPPHCLLLCVSPNLRAPQWNETSAAAMVVEAIDWMKIRALTSGDRLWPTAMLPRANQIALKGGKRRIPVQQFRLLDLGFNVIDLDFVMARHAPGETVGAGKAVIGESQGFHRVKE